MRGTLVAVLAVAGAVTGCSASTAGTPTASSSATGASRLSPPITSPKLDATSFASHPCDLMKPAQLALLGIAQPGRREDVITGPGCIWRPDDFNQIQYSAVIDTGAGGLESLYQRRDTFKVFEPVTVAEYPAVYEDQFDARSRGSCQVLVSINDTTLIAVINNVTDAKSADYTNSCQTADAFAATIIGNLRSGG